VKKKKLLIVEDDRDIRDIVSYILECEGFEIVATNYQPAHQLPVHTADLILLDEWVDKKEGHMLCVEIKDIHKDLHVPVIILSTAHNIEDIAKTCKADGFVRKPFDVDELVIEVNKCLNCLPPKLTGKV